jgi:cytochrome d ubiquinol oxidase subunit II
LARTFAAGQATLILWGWAHAQFPYLIRPEFTIHNCAAPVITLQLLLVALIAGSLVLFPSIYYLLTIFHQPPAADKA